AHANNVTLTANSIPGSTAISEDSGSAIKTTGTLLVNLPGGDSGTLASLTSASNSVSVLKGSGTGTIQLNNGSTKLTIGTFASGLAVVVNQGASSPGTITTASGTTTVAGMNLTGSSISLQSNLAISGSGSAVLDATGTTGSVTAASTSDVISATSGSI